MRGRREFRKFKEIRDYGEYAPLTSLIPPISLSTVLCTL